MTVKDILVHLDTLEASNVRLRLAARLADRFNGYVTGVGLEEAVLMEEKFTTLVRRGDLRGEWQTVIGLAATFVTRRARAADLIILGQHAPDHPAELDAPEDVILACGRPVLVLPTNWRAGEIAENVLIAWNGSREAARAAHDALPLMALPVITTARTITVVSVNPDPGDDWELGGALVHHLARHGLDVAPVTITTELSASEAVLSRAADTGADLIVMGAYSHSRVRETILGGMTRDILRNMTMPVLMSH